MTKDGFFKKYEYVYDEYNDCYICPAAQVLRYSTTNRDGYKEYKSCKHICADCEYLSQCTASKEHQKTVTRHVWEEYMEVCEDIRHTVGMKELLCLQSEKSGNALFCCAKMYFSLKNISKKLIKSKKTLTKNLFFCIFYMLSKGGIL